MMWTAPETLIGMEWQAHLPRFLIFYTAVEGRQRPYRLGRDNRGQFGANADANPGGHQGTVIDLTTQQPLKISMLTDNGGH